MLGVDWEADSEKGRYRFSKIYKVADWTRDVLPPLARPGVNVKENDYLIKVDGIDVTTENNIYSYFQDLAGRQVTLLVSRDSDGREAREVTVKPLGGEHTLRYLDWVEHNRMVASRESNGEIGYIHLPDTYLGSAREFPKYFYSQTRKKGLIVDGRFNGGGLNPAIFLRRLRRAPLTYWTRRYSHDQTSPSVATRAHMVCLTNKQAGSGGDELPMEFQMTGMGPVIGTRTWGGLVGVSMWINMIDGGGISAPDYRVYDRDGGWIVENKGIEPDIVIDLDPVEVSKGYDAQLMKAIEVLKEKIKNEPRAWPQHGSYPDDKFMK
jgi:tricorn protease